MNNEQRVVDYFAIVGLKKPYDHDNLELYPDISTDAHKSNYKRDPLIDLIIINKALQEQVPDGYECLTTTPNGYNANLHGNTKSNELYLCYKRGRDQPPITDIGVLYEGKERLMDGCHIIRDTLSGASANVNTNSLSAQRIFVTFRRATENACNSLAAIDVCVIIKSKGEIAPHSFNEIPKNLNTNIIGASIYICYKKALIPAKHIKYLPKVLFHYPQTDLQSYRFPLQVATFGLPMGASIECWPKPIAQQFGSYPSFSTFILNVNDGGADIFKIYGACITFYESYSKENLSEEQMQVLEFDDTKSALKTNKCILLLSQHPFFESFRKFLYFLHKLCFCNISTSVPIERYVAHFLNKIPFPSVQKPRVLVNLAKEDEVSIYLPEESILPQSGASFLELLKNLGSENCINVLLFALLQKSLMVHSLRQAVLTGVVEAISCIIFPFLWRYAYIPMLPLSMCHMIDAPGSFIFGMDSRYFDMFEQPPHVICVDLDTNSISWTEDRRNLNIKQFPKRALNALRNRLNALYNEIQHLVQIKRDLNKNGTNAVKDFESKIKKQERNIEISIREAFLRFMVAILQNYKSYLHIGTRRPDTKAKDRNLATYFDIEAFIRSRDSSSHVFFKELVRTQLFNDFIINISFLSELDSTLADALTFFDDCVNRINPNSDKDDVRLLDLNRYTSDQTVFIPEPEPLLINGEKQEFTYNGLGEMNLAYFEDIYPAPQPPLPASSDCTDLNTPIVHSLTDDTLSTSTKRNVPHTPLIGVRSKAEKLQAQKKLDFSFSLGNYQQRSSKSWAYCLLSNTYALWFIYLPVYLGSCESKVIGLNNAFKILVKIQKQLLTQPDEICYRVFMQLCSLYKLPTLAVKTLLHMRKYKIDVNNITYSYYNKAIIEGDWPTVDRWGKLRLMISIIKAFKNALKERRERLAKLEASNKNKSGKKTSKKTKKSPEKTTSNVATNKVVDEEVASKAAVTTNGVVTNGGNNNPSCSSQSQSITCSLSSIADNHDKSSIDKVSRESADSGAYFNGDNTSNKIYPNSIECFNDGSIDIDVKTVGALNAKVNNGDCTVVKRQTSSASNYLDVKSARSSKHKSKDLNRQLFDSKMKSKTSIVKRQSNNAAAHHHPFSHSICIHSAGILLTNTMKEHEFHGKHDDASSNVEIDLVATNLRKYQSDDSIHVKYLNKLIINNNKKKKLSSSKMKISCEKNEVETNKSETVAAAATPAADVVVDPLGAYLLNTSSSAPIDPLSAFLVNDAPTAVAAVIESVDDEKEKMEKLFDYEPFRAEREEDEKNKTSHECSINNEHGSFNGEHDMYSNDGDEEDLDAFIEEEDEEEGSETEDEEEEEGEGEEDEHDDNDDEEEETASTDTSQRADKADNALLNKYKNANAFLNSFVSKVTKVTNSIELNNKLKDVTKFTTDKLTVLKSSIQTNMPYSMSQQEFTTKLKSFSGYTLNKNLISTFGGNNSNNSLNNSLNSSFKKNSLQKDNRSSDSISQASFDDIEMPEQYDIDDIFEFDADEMHHKDVLLSVEISSCNRCEFCENPLYDEEIMSVWSSNDSELKILCIYCKKPQVPNLFIRTRDIGVQKYLNQLKSGDRTSQIISTNECIEPYLSPLVLRKELENIANNNELTIDAKFMEKRSHIFWNLLWYFKRIQVDSELPIVLLNSRISKVDDESENVPLFTLKDQNRVLIKCKWDEFKSYNDQEPLYRLWISLNTPTNTFNSLSDPTKISQNKINPRSLKKFMHDIVSKIKNNDVVVPMRQLLKERKQIGFSIYREILFLSINALEREHIDTDAFDREYRVAYASLHPKTQELLKAFDKWPNNTSVWCRRLFSPLYL